jgi:hypothetical protein
MTIEQSLRRHYPDQVAKPISFHELKRDHLERVAGGSLPLSRDQSRRSRLDRKAPRAM